MDNQLKQLIGSWIQAIGTVTSAVGSTHALINREDHRRDLNLWGNVLQGTGNALVADGIGRFSLDKVGNQTQAVGNTTVVAGILMPFEEETKQRLNINGNWLQALGGGVSAADAVDDEASLVTALNIIGNILQVIGNSLQAIAGTNELKGTKEQGRNSMANEQSYQYPLSEKPTQNDSEELDMIGSWIQAVGSILTAIAQTRDGGTGSVSQMAHLN